MILVAGGTGTLGRFLIPKLIGRDMKVRILTREPSHASHLVDNDVEIAEGDVRDPRAVERAIAGVDAVVSAVHGFIGKGSENPQTVDRDGNKNLIRSAAAAGVGHFVLMSILGAAADHPTELFRMKWEAEQELLRSGLEWTIVKPTAYMETWIGVLASPLLQHRKAMVFGGGTNPINFVSAADVARAVEQALVDRRNETIVEAGGPEDLGMSQVVQIFKSVTGATGGTRRVPRPMLRMMSVIARPFNPVLARQSASGVVMDTRDQTLAGLGSSPRDTSLFSTSLAEVVKRDYGRGN
jgi:uncharacterized protein YbjT (DUF2867 family)